jgi:hypothetical protein
MPAAGAEERRAGGRGYCGHSRLDRPSPLRFDGKSSKSAQCTHMQRGEGESPLYYFAAGTTPPPPVDGRCAG